MRYAIFIAMACVALAASFEELNQINEELPLENKVPEESLVDRPDNLEGVNVLTEDDLMERGPYWKWADKFKTKDDGKYRLRELMAQHGKVAKRDWVLIESTKSEEEAMVQAQGQAGWWRRRRRHRHRRHRHRRHRHRRHRHRRHRGRRRRGRGFLSRIKRGVKGLAKRVKRGVKGLANRAKRLFRGRGVPGCHKKCYRPSRIGRSVCAYQCKGKSHHHRHKWRHSKLQCRTTASASNAAGVVYAKQAGGYTMVGGGINNHYRAFNKLSAFEESFPHGNNWRCDTGFGPGRVTCYARSCKMAGAHCITRSVHKHGSGTAQATLPGGYIMTSGGLYNHYRSWNKHAAFETSMPVGSTAWRCDMGLGSGRFNCYVRGCKPRHGTRLTCMTRTSNVGNYHNVQCPGHYSMTGCGMIELRRQWNKLSGFEEIRPHGNGCVCDTGFGPGKNRCYARCCRNLVRRL